MVNRYLRVSYEGDPIIPAETNANPILFYVGLHNNKLHQNPGDVVQFAFGDAREAQSPCDC